jgi:hypothetical protein
MGYIKWPIFVLNLAEESKVCVENVDFRFILSPWIIINDIG